MKVLSIDIETFSSVNLQKCGVYKYAESEDFEILLFGYAVDGGAVQVVDLACGEKIPAEIIEALTDDSVIKTAYNATFERVCLSRYLSDMGVSLDPFYDNYPLSQECAHFLNPASWHCTMIWAATLGLPLSLEGVGAVLGLEKQKLTEGKSLIKYFCVPCAPTKVNGGRTRNLPEHDTEKWQQFKAYNLRDVETEMGIQAKLSRFPVSEKIWEEYHLSEEVNDRGIGVDMVLVKSAIEIDSKSREHLTARMQDMTNLDNPNSVQQMKSWLADNGLEMDSLGKKEVAAAIKTAPQNLTDVLSLRQQLAKSSVKKYTAMENAVCRDNRARGMFMFYGANRTGRFAGRLIQLQNLPQNHMEDLAEARGLVRSGNYDALELLYEDIPDTLSQLIRTAFVPQKDRKFIVADFSAIEARVLAWLAGEQWRLRVFEEGKDIYGNEFYNTWGPNGKGHAPWVGATINYTPGNAEYTPAAQKTGSVDLPQGIVNSGVFAEKEIDGQQYMVLPMAAASATFVRGNQIFVRADNVPSGALLMDTEGNKSTDEDGSQRLTLKNVQKNNDLYKNGNDMA